MIESTKMFCVNCGTAGAPSRPAGVFARHGAKLALAVATSLLVWKFQPHMWWIAAMSLLPIVFDLLFAGPDAPHCTACGSMQMIPLDSPRAQQTLREQERAADKIIASHETKPPTN